MKKSIFRVVAVLVLAGCASTGAPEPAVMDMAGSYTFTTTVQGMGVNGQMRITGTPGSYKGAAYTDVTGEIPISSVEVEGSRATIVAETPDGPVEIRMVFAGDTFTGSWALGGDGGSIQGRRVRR